MLGDSSNKASYSIAIASIGLALAVLIAGICWIAVQHGESSPSSMDVSTLKCPLGDSVKCRPPFHLHMISAATSDASPGIPEELWAALLVLGGVFTGALIPSPFVGRPPDFRASEGLGQKLLRGLSAASRLLLIAGAVTLLYLAAIVLSPGSDWTPLLIAGGALLLGLAVPSPSGRD